MRALHTKSFPVSILGHPSTLTEMEAGREMHAHKRVHILKSHPHDEVWQLKVTRLIWSNQEWGTTAYLWSTVTTSKIVHLKIQNHRQYPSQNFKSSHIGVENRQSRKCGLGVHPSEKNKKTKSFCYQVNKQPRKLNDSLILALADLNTAQSPDPWFKGFAERISPLKKPLWRKRQRRCQREPWALPTAIMALNSRLKDCSRHPSESHFSSILEIHNG